MVVALVATSCAPKLTKLPSGPGSLAPDIARVLLESLSNCQRVQSLTAEIGVSGSVGGQRLRTRLIGGFTTSATRLEAAAPFGAPLFIFVATGRDGTLLLPRDRRVVEHGDSTELLAAIAGIKLTPSEMVRTLNGCYIPDRLESPMAIGDNWNDREMLTVAGRGLVMGNADPALHALGLEVLPTNDEDGVAVAIERYVLAGR